MFNAAARDQGAILRNFQSIGYQPSEECWRLLRMAINRDLQAKRLRPNVPIPPRRRPFRYFAAMYRETGSVAQAAASFLRDGSWTSSGGSFRLATALGHDFAAEIERRLATQPTCHFLEVGGGWAGLVDPSDGPPVGIGGLARRFGPALGGRLILRFTNLTRWHSQLPQGVVEHPHVTAAVLDVLPLQGVARESVDIIHSQAAAYFETDPGAFVRGAAGLMRPGGLLIFNYPDHAEKAVVGMASQCGLVEQRSLCLGGMNGTVVSLRKSLPGRAVEVATATVSAGPPPVGVAAS